LDHAWPFQFPGAGGNWQEIMTRWWSPNISVNFAGNADVEREISEDVASYGTQLGWLNEVAMALGAALPADADPKAREALANIKAADEKIGEVIRRRKGNAMEKARDALKELSRTDADGYRRLVNTLNNDLPRSTP
jgi:hypothetical protein